MSDNGADSVFENEFADDGDEEFPFNTESGDGFAPGDSPVNEEVDEDGSKLISLGKDNFSKLLSVIRMVSFLCEDISIKNGRVSQLSDRKTSIFDVSLKSILGESDLLMSRISVKSDLLTPFKTQQVEVSLLIEEGEDFWYKFKDQYSEIKFRKPLERYLTNSYLTEEEVDARLNLDDGGYVFETKLSKFIIERIAAFSKGLEAHELCLEFKNSEARFKVMSKDGASSSTVHTEKNLNREIKGTCNFPINPFLLVEKVDISCFLKHREDDTEKQTVLLRLTSEVEDIPIMIWVLAFLDDD